jgi:O-succinylbenzoate synthase
VDRFDELVVFSIDMRVPFRGIDRREGVLLRRGDRWSEWSPFLEYPDTEAANWLRVALNIEEPELRRLRVPVNVTVPVVSPMRAADMVTSSGCRTAKVKVGDPRCGLDDDLARLAAVRKALGPEGHIRVDANGSWSVDQAERSLAAMSRFKLQYAEQPCETVEELAELRARMADAETPVLIAADESIRRSEDPLRVAELGAVDIVVLKNQPLGGWQRCLQLAAEIDLPVVVSSALETSIGIWEGAQMAAALSELELACGLNTVKLLTDDVLAEPLVARDGYLEINRRPVPDPKALLRVRATRDRFQWWRDRLERCLAIHDEQA